MSSREKFCFAIDRGGTFTDIFCICPGGKVRTLKLLSEDARYKNAPSEGIRRILKEETGYGVTNTGLIDVSLIEWIRMGTTVATNALLERKGDDVALVVNSGFHDLLYIGNQARSKIFDLEIQKPTNLYKKVVELDCRIVPDQSGICQLKTTWKSLEGNAASKYLEVLGVDEDVVRKKFEYILQEGIDSIAVVLCHSYACPSHEIQIGKIAQKVGFKNITLSHQTMPMIRLVNRGHTACTEAYLTPHVNRYLTSFKAEFQHDLRATDILFMQSDGGLTSIDNFRGARAILSGPAGGVVGYAKTSSLFTDLPIIGFDMGGTSTDVSRFDGSYEHIIESTMAGVIIQAPQLDISTVAAGGGSCLFFRSGMFIVGPESAGAHPGPTCYKKNGPLTLTDANLMLGRILPRFFPKIFGLNDNEPLDFDASKNEFKKLQICINQHIQLSGNKKPMSIEEIALGFIRVANETMCRPIRALTETRGFDSSRHVLSCFGGAGGQHACSIARTLGISKVLIHKYAGILSAYGMALADVVHEEQEPCGLELINENTFTVKTRLDALAAKCLLVFKDQHFEKIDLQPFLHLRYDGTDRGLMCTMLKESDNISNKKIIIPSYGDFYTPFLTRYHTEYGFVLENRTIIIDDIRIRCVCKIKTPLISEIDKAQQNTPPSEGETNIYFEKSFIASPIYLMKNLLAGHMILGPAILIDELSTILIEPECKAEITNFGDIIINVNTSPTAKVDEILDNVQLSIFSHRFMSIAEQMGRVLQRTSISTNIKERLDFSCAIFGPDGGLVSNAPHIPVHLGAMQESVKYQLQFHKNFLKRGNVILSNHPQAGGSHLPDLTVITPVFHGEQTEPVFFVASRGHHADIGGITPGSMPAHSKTLDQEGASFKSFLIVENEVFQEKKITETLTTPMGKNSSGTRNLSDNISDLKAQIAANNKGIKLVTELIDNYSFSVVQAYMKHIQENAKCAVQDMIKQIAFDTVKLKGSNNLYAEEYMDDGSPIKLAVTLNFDQGHALFDFSGSGPEVWGNWNAPKAITISALMYCLRCMVGHDIPLNQGCLLPIKVKIPENSILNPSEDAAVVGGNVLTSQRIVDTILKAFEICAASQGCMNNITIGNSDWGYYETVGGGAGAGPKWNGASGVHTHMTNTRITDPEILESRYPIILKKFCLRTDESGGYGRFVGGQGVCRELLFRTPVTLSILTERRTLQPYGMAGGQPGKRGTNMLHKFDGRIMSLGGKASIKVDAGDVFSMKTPGGGGYGFPAENKNVPDI